MYDRRRELYGFNTTTDKIKELNPVQLCTVNLNSMLTHSHPTESQINILLDSSLTNTKALGTQYSTIKKEILANSIRLPIYTTVFKAEIIAIKKDFVTKKDKNRQYIKIFSDLQAAIKVLNNNAIASSIVKQTIET